MARKRPNDLTLDCISTRSSKTVAKSTSNAASGRSLGEAASNMNYSAPNTLTSMPRDENDEDRAEGDSGKEPGVSDDEDSGEDDDDRDDSSYTSGKTIPRKRKFNSSWNFSFENSDPVKRPRRRVNNQVDRNRPLNSTVSDELVKSSEEEDGGLCDESRTNISKAEPISGGRDRFSKPCNDCRRKRVYCTRQKPCLGCERNGHGKFFLQRSLRKDWLSV